MLVGDVLVGPHGHLLAGRIVGDRLPEEPDERLWTDRPRAGERVAAAVDVDDELARPARERFGGRGLGKDDVDRPVILLEFAGDKKKDHQQEDDVDHRRQIEPGAQPPLVDADTHGAPRAAP